MLLTEKKNKKQKKPVNLLRDDGWNNIKCADLKMWQNCVKIIKKLFNKAALIFLSKNNQKKNRYYEKFSYCVKIALKQCWNNSDHLAGYKGAGIHGCIRVVLFKEQEIGIVFVFNIFVHRCNTHTPPSENLLLTCPLALFLT